MIKDFLIQQVFAANYSDPNSFTANIFKGATLESLFVIVTNVLIVLGLGLVLVFLAMGFIKFIISQGDKIATEQAQKWVTYAIVGGIGLFAVFAIKSVILNLVGGKDPLVNDE